MTAPEGSGQIQLRPLMGDGGSSRTALVSLIDVDARLVPEIIDTTRRRLRRYDRIVYLTDNADFRPFRERGAVFEYLPPLGEMTTHAPDLPWAGYLRNRRILLLAKWYPSLEISYGTPFDVYVARTEQGR
jgi:hypothetical protein